MICNECETVAHCTNHGCIPKTTKKDEALKLALEALEQIAGAMPFPVGKQAIVALREALADRPTTTENNGGKTGWPPGLLQDDCKGSSKWLSNRPDAKRRVREALAEPPAQQEPVAWLIWLHGPAGHFDHKQFAELEFDRRNKEYPDPDRKLLPLYTSPPPQRKPLTDLEGLKLAYKHHWLTSLTLRDAYLLGIRDAEAAHGIKKNT